MRVAGAWTGQQTPAAGWKRLPPVDLLVLGTCSQEIPNLRNETVRPNCPATSTDCAETTPVRRTRRLRRPELESQIYDLKLL